MPRLLSRLLRRDPLFFVAWAALGGVAVAAWGGGIPLWAAGLVAAVAVFGAVRFRLPWLHLVAAGVFFAGWVKYREINPAILDALWGDAAARPADLHGTVIDAPLGSADRSRLTVRVERLELRGGEPIREPLRIDVWGPLPAARMGDRIRAEGMLTPLPPPRNPEERSRRGYAQAANGIVAELKVASPFRFDQIGVDWRGRIFEWAGQARDGLSRTISRGLPADAEEVALLNAMVLGVTEEVSPESTEAFLRSGGMHIFSVSGLHVGIFGSVAWIILRAFGVSRRPAIAVILVLGAAYAFVTGLQPPAVRAAIMLGVFLGGFIIRRQPRLLNSAGLAALVIVAFDPHQAFAVGFQLSFAVMVMIGVLDGPMRSVTRRWLGPDPFIPATLVPQWRRRVQGGAQYFADIITISAAAFAGSWLLLWWYFGTMTPAGLVANCALIPLSWGVMALATLSMLTAACGLGFVSVAVNQLNLPLVGFLTWVAGLFAAIPGGHFQFTPLEELTRPATGPLPEMVVFDSGRGCGPQVIRAGEGSAQRSWLIDSGDEAGYFRAIRPWLRRHAGREIEGFFVTHGEKAHVGGYGELREDFAVRRTLVSGLPEASEIAGQLRGVAQGVSAGAAWQAGPDTRIEVVFPPEGFPPQSRADDQCLVLLISLGRWRVLSMADSGFPTEKWIVAHRPDLRAHVVVMGRHGSDHCGLPEFFRSIQPQVVVATSAAFPEVEMIPETMRQDLARAGIALLDQGQSGAVTMRREGDGLVLRGFLDGRVLRVP